jgi:hypothetical protein
MTSWPMPSPGIAAMRWNATWSLPPWSATRRLVIVASRGDEKTRRGQPSGEAAAGGAITKAPCSSGIPAVVERHRKFTGKRHPELAAPAEL